MKKNDVAPGKIYVAKVSGGLTRIQLGQECPYGGWYATNLATHRGIRIRSAAKLRREITEFEKQNLGVI